MDSPPMYRDLRSEQHTFKRARDQIKKWHWGRRVRYHLIRAGVPEELLQYAPEKSPKLVYRIGGKRHHNTNGLHYDFNLPSGRQRATIKLREDLLDAPLARSIMDLAQPCQPDAVPRVSIASSEEAPPSSPTPEVGFRPLTLDVFIKDATGKATDRLIEKEYEVLAPDGEPVKGHKAKHLLRTPTMPGDWDDFGFVLK